MLRILAPHAPLRGDCGVLDGCSPGRRVRGSPLKADGIDERARQDHRPDIVRMHAVRVDRGGVHDLEDFIERRRSELRGGVIVRRDAYRLARVPRGATACDLGHHRSSCIPK